MTYGDTIRSASATRESVATLIEGGLVYMDRVALGTTNTTSTSLIQHTTGTLTCTVNASESVALFAQFNVSISGGTAQIQSTFYEDAGPIGGFNRCWVNPRQNTAGLDDVMTLFEITSPSAGAHTYKVMWKTTANTAYTDLGVFYLMKFRKYGS